jgi:hypothetical protein
VALRKEQWPEAACALNEALSLAHDMGHPWGEARVLCVYGDMHAQKGELELARDRLEAARAIFQRLGARKDSERTEVTLGHLR